MPDVNVKGRYRIYTHDGTSPLPFTSYSSQLCSIRRPNPNTFITISQYVPGSLSPFTTFDPGSSYTIVTRDNTADFSMGPYTRADRLPSSVTVKTPNFYHGLDKNSITVAISSYALSVNNPLSTVFCYIPNQDGYSINSISFDTARYKDGLPSLLTHLTPNSSYQFKTRTPFTFFAPLESEMGDAYAIGNNSGGEYGMGHRFTDSSYGLPGENVYGIWDKIVFSYSIDECIDNNQIVQSTSLAALSSCGTTKALFVLGSNLYGQLGTSSTKQYYATWTRVPGQWQDICLCSQHMLAIDSLGHLYACGNNTYGQLGLGSGTASTNTLTLVDNTRTYIELAAHTQCTMVRDSNGFLYACGKNDTGQLGVGSTTTPIYSLTREALGYTWSSVKANQSAEYFVAISNNKLYGVSTLSQGTYWYGNVTNSPSVPYAFTQEDLNLADVITVDTSKHGTFIRRQNQNNVFSAGYNGNPTIRYIAALTGSSNVYFTRTSVPSNAKAIAFSNQYFYYISNNNGLFRKTTTTFSQQPGQYFNLFTNSLTLFTLSARNDLRPTPTPTPTATPTPTPTQAPGVDKFALIAQSVDNSFPTYYISYYSQIWEYKNNNFSSPTKILASTQITTDTIKGFQPQNSLNKNIQFVIDYEKGSYSDLIAIVSNPATGLRSVYRCTSPSASTWTLISTPSQLNFCSGVNGSQTPTYTSLGGDLLFIDKNNTYYYYSYYCGNTDTYMYDSSAFVSASNDRGVTWTNNTKIIDKNTLGIPNVLDKPPYNFIRAPGGGLRAVQNLTYNDRHKLFIPLRSGEIAQYDASQDPKVSIFINTINSRVVSPYDVICDSDGTYHEVHLAQDDSGATFYYPGLYLDGNLIVPSTLNKFAADYKTDWPGNNSDNTNTDRNRRGGFISLAKRGNIYYILYARKSSTLATGSVSFDRTGIGLIEYNSSTNTYTDTFIAGRQFDGTPLFTFDNTRVLPPGTGPAGLLLSLKLLLTEDNSLIAFCTVGELVGSLDGRSSIYSFKRDPVTKNWSKLSGPNNYMTFTYAGGTITAALAYAYYSTRTK